MDHDLDALMKSYARKGDVDAAEDLFRQMVEQMHPISVMTLNNIIHACTQARDIERAEMYLRNMAGSGLEPDIITYNSVINACAIDGQAARSEQWLRHMMSADVEPSQVTFGTICKAFSRIGEPEPIRNIMTSLEESGKDLNAYFYASLITAYGTMEPPSISGVEEAFREFTVKGFKTCSVKKALVRAVGGNRAAELLQDRRHPTNTNNDTF